MTVDHQQRLTTMVQPYQKVWKRTLYTGAAVASAMTFDRFRFEDQQVYNMSHESSLWTAMMQDVTAHSHWKKRIVRSCADSNQEHSHKEGATHSFSSLSHFPEGGMSSNAYINVRDNVQKFDSPTVGSSQECDNVRDTGKRLSKKRPAVVAEADPPFVPSPFRGMHISPQGHQDHSGFHGGTSNLPTGNCKSGFNIEPIDLSTARRVGSSHGPSGNQLRNPVSMKPRREFPCKETECFFVGTTAEELRFYMPKHKNKAIRCKLCQFQSKNMIGFRNHMRVHQNPREYKCLFSGCNFVADNFVQLSDHLSTHDKPANLKCNVCEFEAGNAGALANHLQWHAFHPAPLNPVAFPIILQIPCCLKPSTVP